MRTRVIVLVLALVGLTLAGCGGGSPEAESGKTPGNAPATTGDPAAGGEAAAILDFSAKTVDGEEFNGKSLAGKPVVLWFWAPWCATCKAEASEVGAVAKKYDGQVGVVGVGGLGKADAMKRFVRENHTGHFTNLVDTKGTVWQKYGIKTQATYVLINADGKKVHTGELSGEQLESKVAELVK